MLAERRTRSAAWAAAVGAVLLAAPGSAAPRRAAATALDDRLYAIALSSATPKVYQDRLLHLLQRRERERARSLKAGRRAPGRGGAGTLGLGVAARTGSARTPEPALVHLLRSYGGEVRRADRAAVSVPPDALPRNLDVTVSRPDAADDAARRAAADGGGLAEASSPVDFGPQGTVFDRPVTITIPYDPAVVASRGLSESALTIGYWNPRLPRWEELASTADPVQKTVSAQTTHFSVYEVLGGGGGTRVAAADASFGFKAVYAFPNPSRGGAAVTFRVQPGLADSLEVRVYDLSGRRVHASSDFRSLGAYDDGNGSGAQYTYDHAWDVSGVASGVYSYVVVVHKAGQADIRKTGKVGVVK